MKIIALKMPESAWKIPIYLRGRKAWFCLSMPPCPVAPQSYTEDKEVTTSLSCNWFTCDGSLAEVFFAEISADTSQKFEMLCFIASGNVSTPSRTAPHMYILSAPSSAMICSWSLRFMYAVKTACSDFLSVQFLEDCNLLTLLTFSLPISEDFWLFPDFPSDRSIFSTILRGSKNTVSTEKRERQIQKSSLIN